jgi:hypothetical protein
MKTGKLSCITSHKNHAQPAFQALIHHSFIAFENNLKGKRKVSERYWPFSMNQEPA